MEMRGSRRMFRSLRRPALVFIRMVPSSSSKYHMVVSCGVPSLLSVASTAKRFSRKNARAFSDNSTGIETGLLLHVDTLAVMNITNQDQYEPVILSAAK